MGLPKRVREILKSILVFYLSHSFLKFPQITVLSFDCTVCSVSFFLLHEHIRDRIFGILAGNIILFDIFINASNVRLTFKTLMNFNSTLSHVMVDMLQRLWYQFGKVLIGALFDGEGSFWKETETHTARTFEKRVKAKEHRSAQSSSGRLTGSRADNKRSLDCQDTNVYQYEYSYNSLFGERVECIKICGFQERMMCSCGPVESARRVNRPYAMHNLP